MTNTKFFDRTADPESMSKDELLSWVRGKDAIITSQAAIIKAGREDILTLQSRVGGLKKIIASCMSCQDVKAIKELAGRI